MRIRLIGFLLFASLIMGDMILAQNPLRAKTCQNNGVAQSPNGAIDRIVYTNNSLPEPIGRSTTYARNPKPHYDPEVIPTGFDRIPNNHLAEGSSKSVNQLVRPAGEEHHSKTFPHASMNFVEREKAAAGILSEASATPNRQNLGVVISRIGMNLAFVLFIAFGIVLLAKQWMKPREKRQTVTNEVESLKVREVLVLDTKTTLTVVQSKAGQVLVASDAQGVKSMVPLPSSFEQTLQEFKGGTDERTTDFATNQYSSNRQTIQPVEPANDSKRIDEKLIQMLLENASRQSKKTKHSA